MLSAMVRCRGVGASRGIAIGPAYLTGVRVTVAERRILRHDREAELARLDTASDAAERQLDRLRRQLSGDVSCYRNLYGFPRAD